MPRALRSVKVSADLPTNGTKNNKVTKRKKGVSQKEKAQLKTGIAIALEDKEVSEEETTPQVQKETEKKVPKTKEVSKKNNKTTKSVPSNTVKSVPSKEVKIAPPSNKENGSSTKKEEKGYITHSSHLSAPGSVLVLGMGDLGQLGLGEDIMERKYPSPISGISNIVQVTCGGVHTVALDNRGQVYTWGCNDDGALGRSVDDIEESLPGPIDLKDIKIIQISAGDSHTAALSDHGTVYCWGTFRNSDGPLGLVISEDTTYKPSFLPVAVYASSDNRAIKVTSGINHVLMLTEKGDIFSFGCGECGQLGRVNECFSVDGGRRGKEYLLSPKVVTFPRIRNKKVSGFIDIFTSENSSFAVKTSPRQVYVWGDNRRSQLGLEDEERYQLFTPSKVPEDWLSKSISEKDYKLSVAGGDGHTIICESGRVYVAGANEYGQLGLSKDVTVQATPTEIKKFPGVMRIACGTRCSFALKENGEVYAWGIGSNCQLGCGQGEQDIFSPTLMKKLDSYRVIHVSSGGQHTALLVQGRVDTSNF